MTTAGELHEVIATQADLTEGLAKLMREQQQAIVHSRPDELNGLVERSENLVRPIRALENERVRLTAQLMSEKSGVPATGDIAFTASELVKHLDAKDASLLASVLGRLRDASEDVLRINRINKPLLEHSQYFIKQTLRAATDDFKKNLVDRKI